MITVLLVSKILEELLWKKNITSVELKIKGETGAPKRQFSLLLFTFFKSKFQNASQSSIIMLEQNKDCLRIFTFLLKYVESRYFIFFIVIFQYNVFEQLPLLNYLFYFLKINKIKKKTLVSNNFLG